MQWKARGLDAGKIGEENGPTPRAPQYQGHVAFHVNGRPSAALDAARASSLRTPRGMGGCQPRGSRAASIDRGTANRGHGSRFGSIAYTAAFPREASRRKMPDRLLAPWARTTRRQLVLLPPHAGGRHEHCRLRPPFEITCCRGSGRRTTRCSVRTSRQWIFRRRGNWSDGTSPSNTSIFSTAALPRWWRTDRRIEASRWA